MGNLDCAIKCQNSSEVVAGEEVVFCQVEMASEAVAASREAS